MDTKEKILNASLELFSRRGFSAVSVRDIAKEVGVRESAMYKHFANKQAVFDTLLERYMQKSNAFMGGIHALPSTDPAVMLETAEMYKQMSDEVFLQIGGSVFTDFLMQPDTLKFWRMISIERLNNPKLAELWNNHLFEEAIAFQTGMFGMLTQIGAIKNVDPEMLAIEFFTPLLTLYINALPYDTESPVFRKMLDFADRHMRHFREMYNNKGEEK